MTEALRLDGVEIALAGHVLVRHLDLVVGPGEIATLMGPSGSGKSTLLAYLGGFLDPAFRARGRVLIGTEDLTALPPEARRLGTLFQDDLLFPHLDVAGNLAFGLPQRLRGPAERRRAVAAALSRADLDGFGPRDPATLSGGQRARIALMRTLLGEPRALLLDEPFGKLDPALRGEFRSFVFRHARESGLPALMVTHDPADAEAAGGRIVDLGTPGGG